VDADSVVAGGRRQAQLYDLVAKKTNEEDCPFVSFGSRLNEGLRRGAHGR
jgi:hypothetical protein